MRLIRITKKEAKLAFCKKETIYFCPVKARPDGPWGMACPISPQGWFDHASLYEPSPGDPTTSELWFGTLAETAWQLAWNNWQHYNACYELGYYPTYWREAIASNEKQDVQQKDGLQQEDGLC